MLIMIIITPSKRNTNTIIKQNTVLMYNTAMKAHWIRRLFGFMVEEMFWNIGLVVWYCGLYIAA